MMVFNVISSYAQETKEEEKEGVAYSITLPGVEVTAPAINMLIGPGDDLENKVPKSIQYSFPQFTPGKVYYKNGTQGGGMMNYNQYLGEMQFLNGDEVLALDNIEDVLIVIIDKRRFFPYNDTEFCEEILANDKIRVCMRRRGHISLRSKMGSYGTTTQAGSVKTYQGIVGNVNAEANGGSSFNQELKIYGDIKLHKDNLFYFMNSKGRFTFINNLKRIKKQFSGNDAKIETFVKENFIDIKNERDLISLLNYCSDL